MKNFIVIISAMTAILFSSNAIAAVDKTPILNKIFKIDTAKKDKKTKRKAGLKTGEPGASPALNEFFSIDEDDKDTEKEKLYVELGDAYTKSKLYKSAMNAYENALQANPNNSDAHFKLGLLYEHYLGDTQKAIYHLKRALKTAPSPKKAEEAKYYLNIMREGKDWEIIKSND
ncbi:MAG: tetratricopeptide repeat protein [Candidatus Omnitrophica bacterium]|nr:tetratricopeptide repeat protein [Candidatus Omnitrophota bacterium]